MCFCRWTILLLALGACSQRTPDDIAGSRAPWCVLTTGHGGIGATVNRLFRY